ncbi:hypothetical protein OGATHE_001044 [Ogataea polymorpha]|uniref:Uncharacterized protein n=1 Tax=Ogataea polymorpha TaxID=460523 RepID=A0A9P8PRX0_9ASCO|nr:hypothetical protein OGATHE_001044 [Ogataea polymorpha]
MSGFWIVIKDTGMEMRTVIPNRNVIFSPLHTTLVLQRSPYMVKQVLKNGVAQALFKTHNFGGEVLSNI